MVGMGVERVERVDQSLSAYSRWRNYERAWWEDESFSRWASHYHKTLGDVVLPGEKGET